MRYSRLKKRRTKKRYAKLILVVLLVFGVVYIFSAGTLGKFVSNLISPILNRDSGPNQTDQADGEPILTVPEASEQPEGSRETDTVKITETLKANSLSLYAIQMGAFTDSANAETLAGELRSRGGAGYILNDGFYRVLAIGFRQEKDAEQVKEKLKGEGIESHLYPITSAGADMEITATEANVNAVRSAYEMWEEKMDALEQMIIELDSDTIRPADAYGKIGEVKTTMAAKREELQALNAKQNNNVILSGLVSLYDSGNQSLDGILAQNSSDKVAISSKIKYTGIEMLMRYKEYMEQITK